MSGFRRSGIFRELRHLFPCQQRRDIVCFSPVPRTVRCPCRSGDCTCRGERTRGTEKVEKLKSAFIGLSVIMLLAAVRSAAEVKPPYEKYVCEGEYFSALVPKEWPRTEQGHPYGDLTKVYGVKLRDPEDRDSAAATISLLYYSGEKFFTDHRQYINARLNSMVREDHDEKKEMVPVAVAGLRGVTFSLKTFELVSRPSERHMPPKPDDGSRIYEIVPPSKKVIMAERYIVLPAGKGFYVLHYRAPEDTAGEYRTIFENVTGSFQPQVK